MKKPLFVVAFAAAFVMLLAPGARAGDFQLIRGDQQLIAPSVGVGVGMTGAYFALRNRGGGVNRIAEAGAIGLATAAWR